MNEVASRPVRILHSGRVSGERLLRPARFVGARTPAANLQAIQRSLPSKGGQAIIPFWFHPRPKRHIQSDHREPINLGQDRMISINELVDMVAQIAGKRIGKRYDLTKPQGVRGRNSDNTRLREVLKWEPQISLEDGLARTYRWIALELEKNGAPDRRTAPLALA